MFCLFVCVCVCVCVCVREIDQTSTTRKEDEFVVGNGHHQHTVSVMLACEIKGLPIPSSSKAGAVWPLIALCRTCCHCGATRSGAGLCRDHTSAFSIATQQEQQQRIKCTPAGRQQQQQQHKHTRSSQIALLQHARHRNHGGSHRYFSRTQRHCHDIAL